jgi:antitoxin component YwqK of YwqJK toxin-antitoxin module
VKRLTDDDLILGDDYAIYHEGEPFTGISYDTRPDGTLWSEITYVRGLKHGPSRTLYPNGQVKSQTHYKLAYAHGWKEEWYPDGRIKRRTLYELAVPVHVQEFNQEGKLIQETKIDPASNEYRQLEQARKDEEKRLARIYDRYGRTDVDESSER